MSKGEGPGLYAGTKGFKDRVRRIIASLPSNPDKLLGRGWTETTFPVLQEKGLSYRTFTHNRSGLEIRHDLGDPSSTGHAAEDHYHVKNPGASGRGDAYLDKDGNPCPRGSGRSHIYSRR